MVVSKTKLHLARLFQSITEHCGQNSPEATLILSVVLREIARDEELTQDILAALVEKNVITVTSTDCYIQEIH